MLKEAVNAIELIKHNDAYFLEQQTLERLFLNEIHLSKSLC